MFHGKRMQITTHAALLAKWGWNSHRQLSASIIRFLWSSATFTLIGGLMKIAVVVSRVVLGLGFTVFGLNILHPFLNQPLPPEGSLPAQFIAVMGPTHWMTLVGLVQLIGGVLVLLGGTAPLGLALLAPVLVNILAFHICLAGGHGITPGLVFSILEIFLVYSYRSHFKPLLTVRALPTSQESGDPR
jgi:putative oxidoreductase